MHEEAKAMLDKEKIGASYRERVFERRELYRKLEDEIVNEIIIKNGLTIAEVEKILKSVEQSCRFIPFQKPIQIP